MIAHCAVNGDYVMLIGYILKLMGSRLKLQKAVNCKLKRKWFRLETETLKKESVNLFYEGYRKLITDTISYCKVNGISDDCDPLSRVFQIISQNYLSHFSLRVQLHFLLHESVSTKIPFSYTHLYQNPSWPHGRCDTLLLRNIRFHD